MSTVDEARRDAMERKVQGLLAKASATKNEAEAEAFFAKAQELMTKWKLDEMALRQRVNGGSGAKESMIRAFVPVRGIFLKQDQALWCAVARANNVYPVTKNWGAKITDGQGVHLFGYEDDVRNARLLATALQLTVARLDRDCPAHLDGYEKFVWRRSFREGFTLEIDRRLTEARRTAAQGYKTGDMLPVLVKRSDDAKEFAFGQDDLNIGKSRQASHKVNLSAAAAGARAGRVADVGTTKIAGGRKELGR